MCSEYEGLRLGLLPGAAREGPTRPVRNDHSDSRNISQAATSKAF